MNRRSDQRNPRRLWLAERLEPRVMLSATSSEPAAASASWFHERTPTTPDPLAERWVVQVRSDVTPPGVDGAAESLVDLPLRVLRGLGRPGLLLVEPVDVTATAFEAALAADPRLTSFAKDTLVEAQRVPNDPRYAEQNNLPTVGAPAAWDRTTGDRRVVTAVIDSGVDVAHPDLYQNIWVNQGELPPELLAAAVDVDGDGLVTLVDLNSPTNAGLVAERPGDDNAYVDALDLLADPRWADGRDTDGNGFVDDFFGWDFRGGSGGPFAPNNPSDEVGHGTHVAGVIGAAASDGPGGAVGVAGLAWNASLMPLKFLDANLRGPVSSAILAINYATMMRADYGADVRVINASWGQTGGFSAELRDAIDASGAAGILFVAAAGNGDLLGVGVDNDRAPFYPASYDLPNVVSVAASSVEGGLTPFSNFGSASVDLAAPGAGVLSAVPGGYATANGTSMAAPHVAGGAALVWSLLPDATVDEVKAALLSGVDPVPALVGATLAGGRFNAGRTLDYDGFRPTAAYVDPAASNVTVGGGTETTVAVRYADLSGIDLATLGADDITVTRLWGDREPATVIGVQGLTPLTDGAVLITYRVAAPGGSWDPFDFGGYRVELAEDSVRNHNGVAAAAVPLGEFTVRVEDPSVYYVDASDDGVDADPADGRARDARGRTTLRAAVQQANADGEPRTIVLDTGVFTIDPTLTSVEVSVEAEPNDSIATAQDLELGAWGTGVEDGGPYPTVSVRGAGDGTFDYYAFETPADFTTATIDIDATNFDAEVFLFGPAGELITQSDDSGSVDPGSDSTLDPFISVSLNEAGRYVVAVGRFDSFVSGFFGQVVGEAPAEGDDYTLRVSVEGRRADFDQSEVTDEEAGDFDVLGDVTIIGAGASTTLIDAEFQDRVFDVQPGGALRLVRVGVTRGAASDGGGIRSAGDLELDRVDVFDNFAGEFGGGVSVTAGTALIRDTNIRENFGGDESSGGGVAIGDALATITGSTIAYNSAVYGGGLLAYTGPASSGLTRLVNTTVSNNTARDDEYLSFTGTTIPIRGVAGGLLLGADARLDHVTVADNASGAGVAGVGVFYPRGFGDDSPPFSVEVSNSVLVGGLTDAYAARVVAGLGDWRNVLGFYDEVDFDADLPLVSLGHNLVGPTQSAAGLLPTDRRTLSSASVVRPLANNGGRTPTHAVRPDGGAVDGADPASTAAVDQRGAPRPFDADGDGDARSDIGAFEATVATAGGVLFEDRDRDGIRDVDEPGLAGRVVYADLNRNGVRDPAEPWTTSRADDPQTASASEAGVFDLAGLPPGEVLIAQELPSGWEETRRVFENLSVDLFGVSGGGIDAFENLEVSADGRYVAFASRSDSLVSDDTNLSEDVFVYDRTRKLVERVSSTDSGAEATGDSDSVSMSADARFLAFISTAALTPDGVDGRRELYVRDRSTGSVWLAPIGAADVLLEPSISDDGRYVAFSTSEPLSPEDTDGTRGDIYVVDRETGRFELVSGPSSNGVAMASSDNAVLPKISGDGRYVAFATSSPRLFPSDRPIEDFFLHDRLTGALQQLNVTSDGVPNDDSCFFCDFFNETPISSDGTLFAFGQRDPDFLPSVPPVDVDNIFVRSITTGETELVSLASGPGPYVGGDEPSWAPTISGDGRFVAYASLADNLVPGSTTGFYVTDRTTGESRRLPLEGAREGLEDFFTSGNLRMNEDGSVIAFHTRLARNQFDTNSGGDAYAVLNPFLAPPGGQAYSVGAGELIHNVEMGSVPRVGSVSGVVYTDVIPNGFFDDGEPGQVGVTVFLDEDEDSLLDPGERATTTDFIGAYAFEELPTNQVYSVALVAPEGQAVTAPAADQQGVWRVALGPGDRAVGRDFGLGPSEAGGSSQNGSVRGVVFVDANGDRIRQTGEPGVGGRVVFIDRNGDGLRQFDEPQTVTRADGAYAFEGLGGLVGSVRLAAGPGQAQQLGPRGNLYEPTALVTVSPPTQPGDPNELVSGDFDGDGWRDVAVALGLSNQIAVLLGDGLGGFRAPLVIDDLGGGIGPSGLVAGPFGGAGEEGLAVANQLNNTVTILTGFNGVGFDSVRSVDLRVGPTGPLGPVPVAVAAGDLDGDGDVDLATANRGDDSVRVIWNEGGAFTLGPRLLAGGSDPFDLVIADFDGAAGMDVAVANFGSNVGGDPFGGVGVLLSDGAGGFLAPTVYDNAGDGLGVSPAAIGAGRLVGDDDHVDLVVANFRSGDLSVLRGTGDGQFLVGDPLSVASGPVDVTAADVDGDGDADLVVSSLADSTGDLSIVRNRGAAAGGGFEPVETVASAAFVGAPVFFHAVDDFDRNGTLDVALGDGQNNAVRLVRNTFVAGGHRIALTGVEQVAALDFAVVGPGDYNGDGSVDEGDRAFWAANYGRTTGAGLAADGNGDGAVDAADYVLWRDAFSTAAAIDANTPPATTAARTAAAAPVAQPTHQSAGPGAFASASSTGAAFATPTVRSPSRGDRAAVRADLLWAFEPTEEATSEEVVRLAGKDVEGAEPATEDAALGAAFAAWGDP